MPLVKAKCTNCGANLQVDSAKDAAICPYCKAAYIVEKAINNYNINNTNNIRADVVNIYGGNSSDFVIRAGELIRYNGAQADVVIPNIVTKIGNDGNGWGKGAFQGCSQLKSVVMPNSVTEIDTNAFSGCKNLKSIIIPYGVTRIGDNAFYGCSGLTSVAIPNSVTEIGASAFTECKSLIEVTLPNKLTVIRGGTFQTCTSLVSVRIPSGVNRILDFAFGWCSSLKNIALPNGLVELGGRAFSNCTSLTQITLPGSLTNIGDQIFDGCANITEITIPGGIKEVASFHIGSCANLHTVIFCSGVGEVNASALVGCPAIRTMTFPDSCTFKNYYKGNDGKPKYINQTLYSSVHTVNASEEWKKKNAASFECLKAYNNSGCCYVATAVYGSYDCPEVWTLRRFRDYSLSETWHGRAFIKLYYAVSPTVVKYFGHTKAFNRFFKKRLDKLVAKLKTKGFEDTPYYDR
jgi:hypothetical protein